MTIAQVCLSVWPYTKHDCSAFVRAVAVKLGVELKGDANAIVDALHTDQWEILPNGAVAATAAKAEEFVVAGLKAEPHGHVVVVVPGPLNRGKYPSAYWGQLGGEGKADATINWAWKMVELPKVVYASYRGVLKESS